MVVVDTTVWVDYFRGARTLETEWLHLELGRQRLGLTDLILCEVLQGIGGDRQFRTVRRALLRLEVFPTGGRELAQLAAENYRKLRRQGRTVRRTIDCLIASYCIAHDHSLLHRDRDFDPFVELLGLRVIHAGD